MQEEVGSTAKRSKANADESTSEKNRFQTFLRNFIWTNKKLLLLRENQIQIKELENFKDINTDTSRNNNIIKESDKKIIGNFYLIGEFRNC